MESLANGIWIANGKAVPFYTLPYTTRMTVVKLTSGDLWVHSPIELTPTLKQQIDALGPVKFLIAPNQLHHLFIAQWQKAYPNALSYGTQGVINKRHDLHFDVCLDNASHYSFENEITHCLVTGSKVMHESVFFHRASKTLIVTDLIENFPAGSFSKGAELIAKCCGVMAPNGQTPLDWRLSFSFSKKEAHQHLQRIINWQPERIVLAHGNLILSDAVDFLTHSFRWLGTFSTTKQPLEQV